MGAPADKWAPSRLASLRRTIETARRFVRCADEFVPADGSHFYPGALDEYSAALLDAFAADGRAWDEGTPPPCPDCPPSERGYEASGVEIRCGSCDRPVDLEIIPRAEAH